MRAKNEGFLSIHPGLVVRVRYLADVVENEVKMMFGHCAEESNWERLNERLQTEGMRLANRGQLQALSDQFDLPNGLYIGFNELLRITNYRVVCWSERSESVPAGAMIVVILENSAFSCPDNESFPREGFFIKSVIKMPDGRSGSFYIGPFLSGNSVQKCIRMLKEEIAEARVDWQFHFEPALVCPENQASEYIWNIRHILKLDELGADPECVPPTET